MTKIAENVVDRLIDTGTIPPTNRGQCVKEVHEMIKPDHTPGGPTAKTAFNLRPAPAGNRCGARTGYDMQSGPFYCGDPATLMADINNGGTVCTCKRHESALKRITKDEQEHSHE